MATEVFGKGGSCFDSKKCSTPRARTRRAGGKGRRAAPTGVSTCSFPAPAAPAAAPTRSNCSRPDGRHAFIGAIRLAASRLKVQLPPSLAIDAEVDLGMIGEAYGLAARLTVSLPGVDRSVAEQLVAAAHETCPYSRATRGNIPVDIKVAWNTRATQVMPVVFIIHGDSAQREVARAGGSCRRMLRAETFRGRARLSCVIRALLDPGCSGAGCGPAGYVRFLDLQAPARTDR